MKSHAAITAAFALFAVLSVLEVIPTPCRAFADSNPLANVEGAAPPALLLEATAPLATTESYALSVPGMTRHRAAAVDLTLLHASKRAAGPGSSFALELFDGTKAVMTTTRIIEKDVDVFVIQGTLDEDPYSEVALSVCGGAVFGQILSPKRGQFEIVGIPGIAECLVEVGDTKTESAQSDLVPCDACPAVHTPDAGEEARIAGEKSGTWLSAAWPLDVLVVYSEEVLQRFATIDSLTAVVNHFASETNRAFENSRIYNMQVRIVGVVSLEEAGITEDYCGLLPDCQEDRFHSIANVYGADRVCFMCGTGWDGKGMCCGRIFYIGGGADSLTFAHELGHTLCCNHEPEQVPMDPTGQCQRVGVSATHGYVTPDGRYGTIMAYAGSRINYFSDPLISFNGYALGNLFPERITDLTENAWMIREFALSSVDYCRSKVLTVWPIQMDMGPDGGTETATVTYRAEQGTDTTWSVVATSIPSWVEVSPGNGSFGADPSTMNLNVALNDGVGAREATLRIAADSTGATAAVTVVQQGRKTPPRSLCAVSGLSSTTNAPDGSIILTWSGLATRYRVYRAGTNDFAAASLLADWQAEETFVDMAPAPGTKAADGCSASRRPELYYWVTGDNGYGETAPSNAAPLPVDFPVKSGVAATTTVLTFGVAAMLLMPAAVRRRWLGLRG